MSITLAIGGTVGMRHHMAHSLDEMFHIERKAVYSPINRFHHRSGTVHTMRSYAEVYDYGLIWMSFCGQLAMAIDSQGTCHRAIPYDDHSPWCRVCRTCEAKERLAQKKC